MPFRPCPVCAKPTPRVLEAASDGAVVWYVRCQTCGHVWTVSKDGKETVKDVTNRTSPHRGTPVAKPEDGR